MDSNIGLDALPQRLFHGAIYQKYNDFSQAVAHHIKEIMAHKSTPLIGIVGLNGTGKTVLRQTIEETLGKEEISVAHVPLDGFQVPRAQRQQNGWTPYQEEGFDAMRAVYHLQQLQKTRHCLLPLYDHSNGTISQHKSVSLQQNSIIMTDSMVGLRLHNHYDFLLYLFASDAIRLERVLARDPIKRGHDAPKIKEKFEKRASDFKANLTQKVQYVSLAANTSEVELGYIIAPPIKHRRHL